jgi:hypothetical protein
LSLLLLFTVSNADRGVVIAYSGITLMVAFALSFIRGEKPQNPLDAGQAVDQP